MKFRSEYIAQRAAFSLDPEKPVVLIGSCFSQNIVSKMQQHLWESVNPFGTLYNPLSICMALDLMADEENGAVRFEESLFETAGLWNSWWFDSSFSSHRKDDCLEEFKMRQRQFFEALEAGGVLIVTFGTSICYYLEQEKVPVGNCHKQPSKLFYRDRLPVGEMVKAWNNVYATLCEKFPGLKVIFTVSPVRHLKDGFEGNARSKAILLLGVEEIVRNNSDSYYFPAYEILNDDLRDYRFYASDLVHPSEEAIEYVWEKFKETFLDAKSLQLLSEGLKRYKASRHRPKTGALGKPLQNVFEG